MLYQLYIQPTPLPKDALFRPVVTTGLHSSLPECDYNLHKSNSTYFADLDISRTNLMTCILRKGIREAGQRARREDKPTESGVTLKDTSAANDAPPAKGRYMMALGGVSCNFKREIKPYERFEIWTRVLSWDKKWIYLVSWIVKEGVVKPDEWALQTGKRARGGKSRRDVGETEEVKRERWQKAVFATSVAKYVVKKGRMTIPPDTVFRNSALMPLRPGEDGYKKVEVDEKWTWDVVEQERLRGLKLIEEFGAGDHMLQDFPLPAETMRVLAKATANGHENGNGHADADAEQKSEIKAEKSKVRILGQYKDFAIPL